MRCQLLWLADMLSNYLTKVTLIAYIQNMVCKLHDMQIAGLKNFCAFESSVAAIFHSTHILITTHQMMM
jgi:hypothetical protein